ncbi:hypothetical protein CEXT_62741 [Caerostris extrusa]|uniref:Uncharacterized protein n=1 Tax=Caerostris extrusa TaxID=172846 RepID=A0AAV4QV18_CAEEX|nr:hypothetical protein CEXT_62741 [Caerostris extrusa]
MVFTNGGDILSEDIQRITDLKFIRTGEEGRQCETPLLLLIRRNENVRRGLQSWSVYVCRLIDVPVSSYKRLIGLDDLSIFWSSFPLLKEGRKSVNVGGYFRLELHLANKSDNAYMERLVHSEAPINNRETQGPLNGAQTVYYPPSTLEALIKSSPDRAH